MTCKLQLECFISEQLRHYTIRFAYDIDYEHKKLKSTKKNHLHERILNHKCLAWSSDL